MDPRLQQAIQYDDVEELHRLIVEDPKLLDRASKDPFPNTPLHVAASAGKTQVAMELAILKPSFARKLNPEGYSPMHLALQHEHHHTVRALMTLSTKLIRIRGRCGITPLHYVAGKDGDIELELLAEFLNYCKSSIEDLTSQCETAIHIAVKCHNLKAFKVLYGWLKHVRLTHILDRKDQDGNTVLHIAAYEEQPKIIELLIGYTTVEAKNFQGKTALEIFQVNPSGDQDLADRLLRLECQARDVTILSLSQFFSREKRASYFRVPDESARNTILVVSTLIAAATYQADVSPAGGDGQDSLLNPTANSTVAAAKYNSPAFGRAGNIITHDLDLLTFVIFNSMAFFASIAIIWAATLTVDADPWFRIPILLFVAAYCSALILQNTIAAGVLMILILLALGVPWQLGMWRGGVRRRIVDATGRHVATFEDGRLATTFFYGRIENSLMVLLLIIFFPWIFSLPFQ